MAESETQTSNLSFINPELKLTLSMRPGAENDFLTVSKILKNHINNLIERLNQDYPGAIDYLGIGLSWKYGAGEGSEPKGPGTA